MGILFYFFLDGNEKWNELRKKNGYIIFTFFLDGNEKRNELRKKNGYIILLFLRWKWKCKMQKCVNMANI